MWVAKGVLFGVVIFLVAGITYILIRVGITKYRIAQAGSRYCQFAFDARWLTRLIHLPIIWAARRESACKSRAPTFWPKSLKNSGVNTGFRYENIAILVGAVFAASSPFGGVVSVISIY